MATANLAEGRVEALGQVLSYLVTERQRLRHEGADRVTLEANRRAIVSTQSRLSRALSERYAAAIKEQRAASPDQEETTAR
jgi:hypothetical protein